MQLALWKEIEEIIPNGSKNKIKDEDKPFHDWYRFVLSYPPHLVNDYIDEFDLTHNDLILDPFCGTGTTNVVAKLRGIPSIGIEANPMAYLASKVKTNWQLSINELSNLSNEIKKMYYIKENSKNGSEFLTLEKSIEKLIIKNSISPIPLHKSLILLESIHELAYGAFLDLFKVLFAKTVVKYASNLHFGPEVGVSRKKKCDADIILYFMQEISQAINDLSNAPKDTKCEIFLGDSRENHFKIKPNSVSAVITSPPYPNEKDYSRTTRLESVLLGFINSKEDLRTIKKTLLRSNTRTVYKDDADDKWIEYNPNIQNLAEQIENKRIELGKTSGFERLYSKVVKQYFGGMAKHLKQIKYYLKPNALLAYVVGDQYSYFKIPIKTGSLLSEIADNLGYETIKIDLFRTRVATATKKMINEEVLILRKKG